MHIPKAPLISIFGLVLSLLLKRTCTSTIVEEREGKGREGKGGGGRSEGEK